MFEGSRERDRISSNSTSFHRFRHDPDQEQDKIDNQERKRSHRRISSQTLEFPERSVYVRNIPPEKLTDQELIQLFSPYGSISDIRVFKDHLVVQYQRAEQAERLIDSQQTVILRSRKLDICSADVYLASTRRSASRDNLPIKDDEPDRKRFIVKQYDNNLLNRDQRQPRTGIDFRLNQPNGFYTILSGTSSDNEPVDCQILIVNIRQRNYAERIEKFLLNEGIRSSVRLLREDFTLTEAVENAKKERSLYAIIAMPMHEERRTASFHILHGQTEEHRNLSLNDGYEIIMRNFSTCRKRPLSSSLDQSDHQSSTRSQMSNIELATRLTINDRLPLSMLLCLLADGRQLTLDEIDRVLVYLLEKKAKMLTLPEGTLPPLPVQYANKVQSGVVPCSDGRQEGQSTSRLSSDKSLTPIIAEQIWQILSSGDCRPSNETRKDPTDVNQKLFKTEQSSSPQVNPLLISPSVCTSSHSQPLSSLLGSSYSSVQSTTTTTTTNQPNGINQNNEFIFSNTANQNLYPFALSSSQLDSIYHSYSQLNPLSMLSSSTINQSLFTGQQQAKHEN